MASYDPNPRREYVTWVGHATSNQYSQFRPQQHPPVTSQRRYIGESHWLEHSNPARIPLTVQTIRHTQAWAVDGGRLERLSCVLAFPRSRLRSCHQRACPLVGGRLRDQMRSEFCHCHEVADIRQRIGVKRFRIGKYRILCDLRHCDALCEWCRLGVSCRCCRLWGL